jgi:hypothetical protein
VCRLLPASLDAFMVICTSAAAKSRKDRPVSLDLRDVTYIDEDGKHILRQIEYRTGAQLIATTPWTRHLVAQIRDTDTEE